MVVAQLKEWSLPTPEVRGSNPVINKILIEHLCTGNGMEKTKLKKRGQEWPIKKLGFFKVGGTYLARSPYAASNLRSLAVLTMPLLVS